MDKIKIPTSFNIELEFELADLMRRFFGWFIDFIVQIAYLMVVSEVLESYSKLALLLRMLAEEIMCLRFIAGCLADPGRAPCDIYRGKIQLHR